MGYWEPHTGAPDWCEKNYAFTIYIAEFWNTLSSLPLVFVGAYGLWTGMKYNYEFRFGLCNFVLMMVGVGSAAFHGTLNYEGQCMDELAMIYCALAFVHAIMGAPLVPGLVMLAYSAIFTYIYFNLKGSIYFQVFIVMYAVSVVVLVIQSYRFAIKSGRPQLLVLVKTAACFYIGGFLFLWIPEHVLCVLPTTDDNRPPVIEAVQLHAWFHITSTIGPYTWILFALLSRYPDAELRTTAGGLLPYVTRPAKKQ